MSRDRVLPLIVADEQLLLASKDAPIRRGAVRCKGVRLEPGTTG